MKYGASRSKDMAGKGSDYSGFGCNTIGLTYVIRVHGATELWEDGSTCSLGGSRTGNFEWSLVIIDKQV
jgi:hypothetical protein